MVMPSDDASAADAGGTIPVEDEGGMGFSDAEEFAESEIDMPDGLQGVESYQQQLDPPCRLESVKAQLTAVAETSVPFTAAALQHTLSLAQVKTQRHDVISVKADDSRKPRNATAAMGRAAKIEKSGDKKELPPPMPALFLCELCGQPVEDRVAIRPDRA